MRLTVVSSPPSHLRSSAECARNGLDALAGQNEIQGRVKRAPLSNASTVELLSAGGLLAMSSCDDPDTEEPSSTSMMLVSDARLRR